MDSDTTANSNMTDKRLEHVVSKLRSRGFRITPQRLAVIAALVSSREHPSVEQVYEIVREDFPTTSLATVYKTISVLKEMGEVLELGFPDRGNRYDGNRPDPHAHAICTKCARIVDPESVELDQVEEEMSARTGFKLLYHRLDFYGICPECQKER